MSVSAEETGGDAFAGYGSDGKPDFWVSTGRPAGEVMHFHVAFVAKDRGNRRRVLCGSDGRGRA